MPSSFIKNLYNLLPSTLSKLRGHWGSLNNSKYGPLIASLLLTQLVFAGILGLRATGLLEFLELSAYDVMLSEQAKSFEVDDRIVLVWYTDEDQRHWGYPLPDRELVKLFERLLAHDPQVVGLDLYRDLPVPSEKGAAYERLSELFRTEKRIIGIEKFSSEDGVHVAPPEALEGTGRVGFNDFPLDSANMIRRGLFFLDDGTDFSEYFSLIVARHYLARFKIYLHNAQDGQLMLGDVPLPPPLEPGFGGYDDVGAGGYQFLSLYPGAPRNFTGITVTEVLNGEFAPDLFKDKIVLIGSKAEATPDFFNTPPTRWSEVDPRMPGMAIHAYNLSQILRMALKELPYSHLKTWGSWKEVAWIWLWSLMGTIACVWARNLWRFIFVTTAGLLVLWGSVQWAFHEGWWLLVAYPAIAWSSSLTMVITYLSYQERSNRALLMQLFSKHVSKDVAEVIWESREQYLSKGRLLSQRLCATVLFTDLQNFTTVSEHMEPQALMDWLNEYMETMVNVVENHHGQVNKFIGDAVMALFGVPIPRQGDREIARDAINAVHCALAMRAEIEHLRHKWAAQGMPLIRMRVGIYTGHLVAGSLGGVDRQEYTVIGDTVNTASRLESYDKSIDAETPCRILIGQSTQNYIGDLFITEQVGQVHLKGKAEPVIIYRVVGKK